MPHTLKTIAVADILFDADNPRFFHLKLKDSNQPLNQATLMKELLDDPDTPTMTKSIKKTGVVDPIWVKETVDGQYKVIEGNRRTSILKRLLEEHTSPPAGVRYDVVAAHVYPSNTSLAEELFQKAILQTGKKQWGPFNEAATTWELRYTHNIEIEDIAMRLMLSVAKVKQRLDDFKQFTTYATATKDANPKRFSFFAEAPKRVREWYGDSEENLNRYHELICPTSGKAKLRSAATSGGLRDFAKILDDSDALDALLNDPEVTVEQALDIAKSNDISKGMPFMARLRTLAQNLQGVTEEQLTQLRGDTKHRAHIRDLQLACEALLKRIDKK
jgi:hypothetical protein